MNYKGIVDWLQEDGFVLMGFSDRDGTPTLMEKITGREVNDLPSFLIATVLPIAKKKVIHELRKEFDYVKFQEVSYEDICHVTICGVNHLSDDPAQFYAGSGKTGEYAMVNAIEVFITNQQEKIDDKG